MQQALGTSIVLILGGVRSGKSRYAQQLAENSARVKFVATAERRDDEEMRRKIERHRTERPAHWTTVEEPLELSRIIKSSEEDCDAILIDCLTLFGANLMERYDGDENRPQAVVEELCATLKASSRKVILVSNEVGSGVVGEINQRVAAVADTVLFMVAGLPLPLKGGHR